MALNKILTYKAVFLDKDGTLIKNVPHNIKPEKIRFYSDVPRALYLLKENGFKLIIITNQSGVALGCFKEDDIKKVKEELEQRLEAYNVKLDGFYYCPHYTKGSIPAYSYNCLCRKPKPGMILQAANEFNIDLSKSWMVGDILNDVEAGNYAGCKSILIENGNETEWIFNTWRTPFYIVETLTEAAVKIIEQKKNC